jgi:GAF domain-containing protein
VPHPSPSAAAAADLRAARALILESAARGAAAVGDPLTAHKFLDWAVEAMALKLPHFSWSGVYLVRGPELVLQCYRGAPSPHARIPLGHGICGAAVSEEQTIVVHDVHGDPRYLACSVETRSEIVVPIRVKDRIVGEIDIDSHTPAAFTDDDRAFLERLAEHMSDALAAAGAQPPEPPRAPANGYD